MLHKNLSQHLSHHTVLFTRLFPHKFLNSLKSETMSDSPLIPWDLKQWFTLSLSLRKIHINMVRWCEGVRTTKHWTVNYIAGVYSPPKRGTVASRCPPIPVTSTISVLHVGKVYQTSLTVFILTIYQQVKACKKSKRPLNTEGLVDFIKP